MTHLIAKDDDLGGLADGSPLLDATGIRLTRRLGLGGMAAVFHGIVEGERGEGVSARAPREVAVKLLLPSAIHNFRQLGFDETNIVGREVVALQRVAELDPPTEFVIGFYGNGITTIELRGNVLRVPWLLLEYIDGGNAGTSLDERVGRAGRSGGVDPIRAHRLISRLLEGARVLHEVGVIHRDLKPENVLVAGPVDDETPKIADCGIARVTDVSMTLAAYSPPYAAPEQLVSLPKQTNPLIGPWTDVHALAAIVWFVLTSDTWMDRAGGQMPWGRGERPSIEHGRLLHPGFRNNPKMLRAIDQVLQRGAAAKLPAVDLDMTSKTAALYVRRAADFAPSEPRYASVQELASALLPLLEESAQQWKRHAAEQGIRNATAFRETLFQSSPTGLTTLGKVTETRAKELAGATKARIGAEIPVATPGSFVFRSSGRMLGRFGDRLLYFVDEQPHNVKVPADLRARIAGASWLTTTPSGGFALVGADGFIRLENGALTVGPPLVRARGGEVGPIEAAAGLTTKLAFVTSETNDSDDGPELWRSADGTAWGQPIVLDQINGRVRALAEGPSGTVIVGSSRNGKKARALVLGLDDKPASVDGIADLASPLSLVLCGADLDAWAVSDEALVRIHLGTRRAENEKIDLVGTPVAMGLDPIGNPWLLTTRAVLRRHVDDMTAVWKTYYARGDGAPLLGGLGFTPTGAVAIDVEGTAVKIAPFDIAKWTP